MKTSVLLLALLALAACEAKGPETASAPPEAAAPQPEAPAPAQATPVSTLPEAFHGRWDKDAAACANAESTQIVTVGPNEVRFFESMATVKSVTVETPNAVTFEGHFSGEGEESEGKMRLEISAAGDTLKVDAGANGLLVRCPKPN